jgi:glutathione synthase/RimK-type ligase-like ATP-grasp enzyme
MIPVIVNPSHGWAFEGLAQMLSRALWIDVREEIGDFNYLLELDVQIDRSNLNTFIPIRSIELASDKRKLEQVFDRFDVKRPKTFILEDADRIDEIIKEYPQDAWVLKYPTGCGAMHHQLIEHSSQIPLKWERPFLLQQFIKSDRPEVYRLYCVDGDIFGFNARRFEDSAERTLWVSHANGARYVHGEHPDNKAIEIAKQALIATELYQSFGAVDLIKDNNGEWYVLEVGTDGIYNYVDRDLDNENLLHEINERLAKAFWHRVGVPPWGKTWKYRDRK